MRCSHKCLKFPGSLLCSTGFVMQPQQRELGLTTTSQVLSGTEIPGYAGVEESWWQLETTGDDAFRLNISSMNKVCILSLSLS